MATTFFYLEAPNEHEILRWFRSLSAPPSEVQTKAYTVFHFRDCGELEIEGETRQIDATRSPIVTVFEPDVQRGVLWSVGEVRFPTKHIRTRFPELARIQKRFFAWLSTNPVVWDRRDEGREGHGYFFEGQIKNIAERIYALPSGLAAHEAGRYFVCNQESEFVLDRIAKSLRLRGVDVGV